MTEPGAAGASAALVAAITFAVLMISMLFWWMLRRRDDGKARTTVDASMSTPEPLLSVECRCRCNCDRRPNRRITCELCNWGVGPGCCARNAEGGTPEIGATTCICHVCLTEGPPPLPNPQEEKELRMAAVVRVVHPCELDSCSCCPRTGLPFVWVPGEEKPRCFECAKPVQEFSRLESLDRAAARWGLFYLGLLDIM